MGSCNRWCLWTMKITCWAWTDYNWSRRSRITRKICMKNRYTNISKSMMRNSYKKSSKWSASYCWSNGWSGRNMTPASSKMSKKSSRRNSKSSKYCERKNWRIYNSENRCSCVKWALWAEWCKMSCWMNQTNSKIYPRYWIKSIMNNRGYTGSKMKN